MKRHHRFVFLFLTAVMAASISVDADDNTGAAPTVGIIGTGDMGDSLGPRFAELGYRVVYGSRNPDSEKSQNLGSLDGKIVIDISIPSEQAEDGYYVSMVASSSAEMIQSWNPGARVVKAFGTQASYVIDDPDVVGGLVTVPIATDDREAKEQVARIVAAMGLDPVDAGNLAEIPETQNPPKPCPGT